jgi:hypothetical protein
LAWYVEQWNNHIDSNNIEQNLGLIIFTAVVPAGLPAALGADTGELSVSVYEPNVQISLNR